MDVHDDLLNDFLVEAGELLEQLHEQLVDLERDPRDLDLLNAVFRAFHTIKGGAGFLQLEPLVESCHTAENAFVHFRSGEATMTAECMDDVLAVVDAVEVMLSALGEGRACPAGGDALAAALARLALVRPDAEDAAAADDPVPAPAAPVVEAPPASDDISDDEFEALLDQLHGAGKSPTAKAAVAGAGPDAMEDATDVAVADDPLPRTVDAPQATPAAAADVRGSAGGSGAGGSGAGGGRSGNGGGGGKPPGQEPTVRVDTARLDQVMNLVGELVLVRNRLVRLSDARSDDELAKAVANLDLITADLQTVVMKTRMQPIRRVFGRFPRVVRDLARSLGKQVDLVMKGEDTDLDKNLVEGLADPLIHLVRNAVDHGVESPEERVAAGKTKNGRVELSAEQEGDHILLTITDDGKGMDADMLRRKAVEKGMMDEENAARLSDEEAFGLIFEAGFSTKTEVSDVSGRGVGMDVVKTTINQLNGAITVRSEPGKGTQLLLKVPLTLAIMPTLMIKLGEHTFALPLASVIEILNVDMAEGNVVDGREVIVVRGKPIPMCRLGAWLGLGEEAREEAHVVIVSVGSQQVAFVVDVLIGQEEVVIKPLGGLLQGTPGFAGATITGDGKIALILDVPSMVGTYA